MGRAAEIQALRSRIHAGEYNNDVKGAVCDALAAYAGSLTQADAQQAAPAPPAPVKEKPEQKVSRGGFGQKAVDQVQAAQNVKEQKAKEQPS